MGSIVPILSSEHASVTNTFSTEGNEEVSQERCPFSIPVHSLGVKPSGNQYNATSNARHTIGLFEILPDEVITIVLEYFESSLLESLGSTCKFLYAFCKADDLWKLLFIESSKSASGVFQWRGTWRSTLLELGDNRNSHISCGNVFSDVLYRPFLCAHTPLNPYALNIPKQNAITYLDNLSAEEFTASWSDRPFILTQIARQWPLYETWSMETLMKDYGNLKFRAEAVDWSLQTYSDYMHNNNDESPLYLFDRTFVEKMQLHIGKHHREASYWIPECFGEDLFAVLGDNRPDDKWLIIGPARSGSTYHKDPNATSAWNAVIRGLKYWIMFPSHGSSPPPPGVWVSGDQSEVTSPLSIAEWLIGFHEEARKTPGCVEGLCKEGEVLHIPSGWWHLVVNLKESIAITQNFVPRSHLVGVLSFLRDKPDQVSGFKKEVTNPYATFVQSMQREHPELLQQALEELKRKTDGKKRKWDEAIAVRSGEDNHGGFSFGFGEYSDEEIP